MVTFLKNLFFTCFCGKLAVSLYYKNIIMEEYKIMTMFYDDEHYYHIEDTKGRLVIGRLSYKEAQFYINNPEILKSTLRRYRIVMWGVITFVILSLVYIYTLN